MFFERVIWIYTADRNLEKFKQFGLDISRFRLIPNGISRRLSSSPISRADLGIPETAIVFLFAARSHPEKGWCQTAAAFDRLSGGAAENAYLLMVGRGEEADAVGQKYADNARIMLLGFRSDLDDLLEVSDFTVLPSRFQGESMPLFLIQSILAKVPVIATNVGQIKELVVGEGRTLGVVIEPIDDDERFVEALHEQMTRAIRDGLVVAKRSFNAVTQHFSIERCVDQYTELYQDGGDAAATRSIQGRVPFVRPPLVESVKSRDMKKPRSRRALRMVT